MFTDGINEDTGARVEITGVYITPHVPDIIGEEADAELGFQAGTLTTTTVPDGEAIVGNTVRLNDLEPRDNRFE